MDANADSPSTWTFILQSCGTTYVLFMIVVALLSFALTLALALRGRGSVLVAILLLAAFTPVFIGLSGTVGELFRCYEIIAHSPTSVLPREYAQGISMSLVPLWLGIVFSVPSYLAAAVAMTARALIRKWSDPAG